MQGIIRLFFRHWLYWVNDTETVLPSVVVDSTGIVT
jgi:hypothetical protein